jgi:hypothetical protein
MNIIYMFLYFKFKLHTCEHIPADSKVLSFFVFFRFLKKLQTLPNIFVFTVSSCIKEANLIIFTI